MSMTYEDTVKIINKVTGIQMILLEMPDGSTHIIVHDDRVEELGVCAGARCAGERARARDGGVVVRSSP